MTEPDDLVTITVSRADIDRVCECARVDGQASEDAANRILAALPEPEWEPSEELIDRYCEAFEWSPMHSDPRLVATTRLKVLHEAGIDLSLREGE